MAKRKVRTVAEAVNRNHPELSHIKDFGKEKMEMIPGLTDAGRRIRYAARTGQPVFLFADYDADGICSAAEFSIIFRELKIPEKLVTIRFPHRFTEGYGMQPEAVNEVPGGALLITVDNGISASAAISKAKARGMTVVVIDHHPLNEGESLPVADIIADPHAIPGSSFDDYCGAGLTLKLAEFLIGTHARAMEKIRAFAAIATIADVVSLTGDNWIIARRGLDILMRTGGITSGLSAILKKAGCAHILNEEDLSYKIIPQLNAPGRLMDNGAEVAYKAITFDGPYPVAMDIANRMAAINTDRKAKVEAGMDAAHRQIAAIEKSSRALTLFLPGVCEGIAGILAGRVAEIEKKPAFVLTKPFYPTIPGLVKGSGRSYGTADLKAMLQQALERGALYGYGGHMKAAGLSTKESLLPALRDVLNEVAPPLSEDVKSVPNADMQVTMAALPGIEKETRMYAPYGEGNPPIIFEVSDWLPKEVSTMGAGGEHLRMDSDGVRAVAFYADPTWIKMAVESKNTGRPLTLIGTVGRSHYVSRKGDDVEYVQFDIEAMAFAKKSKSK